MIHCDKNICNSQRKVVAFHEVYYRLFVSLLSHFWLIHFFHLPLLYQPYLGLCQAQRVQSHQRQPMSAVAITACEVQISAADSQTVPTVATGVWPLHLHWPVRTYRYIQLYYCDWSLYNYTAHAADILTLTTVVQGVDNHSRGFVLSPLLSHPRLLETFQSDIPHFTLTWPAKHSPNQGWESTHRLHLYPLGGLLLPLA